MKLQDLEEYFSKTELPDEIQLDPVTRVTDVRKMVESNIEYLKNHPGNIRFLPYFHQLLKVKQIIEESN